MSRRALRFARFARVGAACSLAALAAACAAQSGSTPTVAAAGLKPAIGAPVGAAPGEPLPRLGATGAPSSLYGLFLAGQAALDRGSSEDAARFLSEASQGNSDPYLKERAFTAAVIAGDITHAAAIELDPAQAPSPSQRLARLVKAVEALATGRGAEAQALLYGEMPEGQTAQSVILLRPWAAAAAGDWDKALNEPGPSGPGTPRLTSLFAAFSRARLLERAGRMGEAEAVYKTLTANADNVTFVMGYGGFLERRKRRADAVALYDRTLAKTRDPEVVAARERAQAGRPAPAQLTIAEAAGQTLLAPALTLSARRQPEMGLAVMRLALRLHPKLDEAWMAVGDAMAAAGDPEAARRAFAQVSPDSSNYGAALTRIAWNLQRAGDSEQALGVARDWLGRSRDDVQALALYADLLRENGRFAESIEQLDKIMARGGGAVESWRLHFLRGVAWERSGRWDKAEPDLREALRLKPDEPDVMNYLGFGWANRYQNLEQALGLLEKASVARPRSGQIRDSLGWAKYRLGRYEDAVRDLERAVQLAPAEADINDHLGDAYWRVGRKLEAEFQWRRVLSLAPEEMLRTEVETKLRQGGLGPSAPIPAAVAAAETRGARP